MQLWNPGFMTLVLVLTATGLGFLSTKGSHGDVKELEEEKSNRYRNKQLMNESFYERMMRKWQDYTLKRRFYYRMNNDL